MAYLAVYGDDYCFESYKSDFFFYWKEGEGLWWIMLLNAGEQLGLIYNLRPNVTHLTHPQSGYLCDTLRSRSPAQLMNKILYFSPKIKYHPNGLKQRYFVTLFVQVWAKVWYEMNFSDTNIYNIHRMS